MKIDHKLLAIPELSPSVEAVNAWTNVVVYPQLKGIAPKLSRDPIIGNMKGSRRKRQVPHFAAETFDSSNSGPNSLFTAPVLLRYPLNTSQFLIGESRRGNFPGIRGSRGFF